jgi:hypothetical protein
MIRATAAALVTVVVFAQVIELVPTVGVNVITNPSTPVPIPVASVRAITPSVTVAEATSLVAVIMTAILLIKVVPIFAETFSGFGADLPAFTLFVLGLSEALQNS